MSLFLRAWLHVLLSNLEFLFIINELEVHVRGKRVQIFVASAEDVYTGLFFGFDVLHRIEPRREEICFLVGENMAVGGAWHPHVI